MSRLWPIALAIFLSSACFSRAMVNGTTSDAEWFQGITNKLLVVQYDSPLAGDWGDQLAQLIGRLALATVHGLTNFAVITLTRDPQARDLAPDGIQSLARKQRAPVVVWGEFYESKGRVFLASHLRYVPMSGGDDGALNLSWDISKLAVPDYSRANATAPGTQVSFAPVEISRARLAELEKLWQRTLELREQPADTAPLADRLSPKRPFYVLGASNGWTHLQVIQGKAGWVKLAEIGQDDAFVGINGVVLYAQGLLQYLAGNHAATRSTFTRYLKEFAPQQDSMNQGLAHVLLGYSYLRNKPRSAQDVTEALAHFQAARKLLPNAASPVNCQAVATFVKAAQATLTPNEVQTLERNLIHVIQTENDLDAVANLKILYRLPRAGDYFKTAPSDFTKAQSQRLKLLDDLERQWKARR